MSMIYSPKAIVIIAVILHSCSFSKYPTKWQTLGYVPNANNVTLQDSSFTLLYTGAGGLVIANPKGDVLMTDPFYANPSFSKTLFGKITSQPKNALLATQSIKNAGIDLQKTKGILVAHTHYDHLLDLPYLYTQNLIDTSNVKIFGSQSTKNVIRLFIRPKNIKTIEDSAYYQFGAKSRRYGWLQITENIKVLPIESQHAAHFKILGKRIKTMNGLVDSLGIKGFDTPTSSTRANRWREGNTFSFLVDFLENGQTIKRIFIQTSACNHPFGLPPEAEMDKKSIDLAILCVASANMVEKQSYPQNHLTYLKPKGVVLVHWENFFREYSVNPKTITATNFNAFFRKLENANQSLNAKVVMPKPLTVIRF